MSEQAMEKYESKMPVSPDALGGVEGLEGLDQGDTIIPRLRIVQPTSSVVTDGDVPAGVFFSNLGGDYYEQLDIVPLFFKKGRVLYEEGEDRPSCKSNDGLCPSDQIEQPVNDVCAKVINGRLTPVCPSDVWTKGGDRPSCQATFTLAALQMPEEVPFLISLKGSSYKAAKKLISYFALRRLSPFSASCQLTTSKQKNSRGTFYVAEFNGFRVVEPADRYREQFASLRDYDIQRTYDAEAAVDSEDQDDAAERPGVF